MLSAAQGSDVARMRRRLLPAAGDDELTQVGGWAKGECLDKVLGL